MNEEQQIELIRGVLEDARCYLRTDHTFSARVLQALVAFNTLHKPALKLIPGRTYTTATDPVNLRVQDQLIYIGMAKTEHIFHRTINGGLEFVAEKPENLREVHFND